MLIRSRGERPPLLDAEKVEQVIAALDGRRQQGVRPQVADMPAQNASSALST